jgi:predicted CoA-binding protein
MPKRAVIDRFLAQRHLALVGVSHDEKQFANAVYRHLRDGGRTMYAVNRDPSLTTVEGDPCYHHLADIPGDVDGVVVMVPAAGAADVVRDAIAAGIPRVWLHRGVGTGSVSAEAIALCEEHGVEVVDGACPMMFSEPVTFIHRVHRVFARRRFVA